jgi:ABC-type transporter Mla MlaB component
MWKMQRLADDGHVVLGISGRIEAEDLSELQKAVTSEEAAKQQVELDLENVRLVDQKVVTFLACCEARGTRLRNCPAYIREWIERERAADQSAVES